MGNEALKSHAYGHHEDFERIVDSASQKQVRESNTVDGIRNVVESAVIVVENRMHDATLTAMNIVVIPRVEMVVKSITGASGNGPNSIIQNSDRRYFTRSTENTPLRSATGWLDSNIEQYELDETLDFDNSEDSNFLATRFSYDRRAQAHHS